jgi:hypothetical protein
MSGFKFKQGENLVELELQNELVHRSLGVRIQGRKRANKLGSMDLFQRRVIHLQQLDTRVTALPS